MKTKDDVEKRLKKLRHRYTHKYIQKTQERRHVNCEFNELHDTETVQYTRPPVDFELSPKRQHTLVTLVDDSYRVHMCMYKSKSPLEWEGNTCNSDDVAKSCVMFKPRVSAEEAKNEFLELVADDEYVFDNYRDVATLQWVLGERVHSMSLSWWEKLILWISIYFSRVVKPTPTLPLTPLPKELWDDTPPNT